MSMLVHEASSEAHDIQPEEEIAYFRGRRESLPLIGNYPDCDVGQFAKMLRKRRESLSENNLLVQKNVPRPPPNRRRSLPFGTLDPFASLTINTLENNDIDQDYEKAKLKGRRQSLPHNIMITPTSFNQNKYSVQRKRKESIISNISIQEVKQRITENFQQTNYEEKSSNKTAADAESCESNESDSSVTVLQDDDEETLSVSEEAMLPPRTPEPEILKEYEEFEKNKAEGSNDESMKSYRPRYCWCTRCQLMYRMFKDKDDELENWGNYPCFHF